MASQRLEMRHTTREAHAFEFLHSLTYTAIKDKEFAFHLTSLRLYVKVLRDDLSLSRVKGLAFLRA